MLGELIANLDQPNVAAGVLATLDSGLVVLIEGRAAATSMTMEEFVSGAVREFVERADDDLWFQLLSVIRRSDDPGLAAVRAILTWVVTERPMAGSVGDEKVVEQGKPDKS